MRKRLIYWIPYHLVGVQLWLHRIKVEGLENLPAGGCLVVANHASYLDPTTVAWSLGREVYYLARKSLFKPPFLDWFLPRVNVLPIDLEGRDSSTLRRLIKTLKEGQTVILFPEGTRTPDGNLQRGQPGAGFVALKAGVPILPVRVFGTYEAFSRTAKRYKFLPLRVVIGPAYLPVSPEGKKDKEGYDLVAQEMMAKIAALT